MFFQAYVENELGNTYQNKHAPFWIDNQINPDIQYILIGGYTNEQAWDDMSTVFSYTGNYATEAVVQVRGFYMKEYVPTIDQDKPIYCLYVDEVYLTDWIGDSNIPQVTPSPNKVEPTQREIVGEGTMEAPFQITIGELKQRPEQYDEKWVEFDAYLYCEKSGQGGIATLLQEYEEETTENRDKIGMVLTEYDDGYEGMKELVEEALRENKTIKVRVKGMFELNPYELKGDVAEKTQFLSMQTFWRIE